jgi:hypothetical protein
MKFMIVRYAEALRLEHALSKRSVALEAIAECASADNVESLGPEIVLLTALGRSLEHYDAVRACFSYPLKLRLPVVNEVDHSLHHIM